MSLSRVSHLFLPFSETYSLHLPSRFCRFINHQTRQASTLTTSSKQFQLKFSGSKSLLFSKSQYSYIPSQVFSRTQYFHSTPHPRIDWDFTGILRKFSGEDPEKKKDPFEDSKKKEETPTARTSAGGAPEEIPTDWDSIARQADRLEKQFQDTLGGSRLGQIDTLSNSAGELSGAEFLSDLDKTPYAEIIREKEYLRKNRKFAKIVENTRSETGMNMYGAWELATDPDYNPNLIQEITYPEVEEPFDLEDPQFLTPYHDQHPPHDKFPKTVAWNPWEYMNFQEGKKFLDQTPWIYDEDYEDLPLPSYWVGVIATAPFRAMRPHQWRPWKPYVRDEMEQKIFNKLKATFPLAKRRAFLESPILLDVRKWPHANTPGYKISIVSPTFREMSGSQANALVTDCIQEFLQQGDLVYVRAFPPYYDHLQKFDVTPNGWDSILEDMKRWNSTPPTETLSFQLMSGSREARGLTSTQVLPVVGSRTINRSRRSLDQLPANLKTAFSLPMEDQKKII